MPLASLCVALRANKRAHAHWEMRCLQTALRKTSRMREAVRDLEQGAALEVEPVPTSVDTARSARLRTSRLSRDHRDARG
jgi:hypothetical protein